MNDIKLYFLVFLIINSNIVTPLQLGRKRNSHTMTVKEKMKSQYKSKSKFFAATYIISSGINGLTAIVSSFANAKKNEIDQLKQNNLESYSLMYEESKLFKVGLCKNFNIQMSGIQISSSLIF